MKTVVREGIWGPSQELRDLAGRWLTYNLGQPRQSWKESGRGVSLAVDGVEDEHEAEAVRARLVLEHLAQLDVQL